VEFGLTGFCEKGKLLGESFIISKNWLARREAVSQRSKAQMLHHKIQKIKNPD
jgi:hypothetical protein